MNWTISYKNQEKSTADWGLSQFNRKYANQSREIITFVESGIHIQDDPLFEPESWIIIKKDNKNWFQGLVTKTPGFANYSSEEKTYEISNSWWHLENLIYQQSWLDFDKQKEEKEVLVTIMPRGTIFRDLVNKYDFEKAENKLWTDKTRVILGQNKEGVSITLLEQVKDVLNFAISHGSPFEIGEIDLGGNFYFPLDEVKDLSCAEVIKRLLRWIPDSITWFDYSQQKPKLHICRKNSLISKKRSNVIDLKTNAIKDIQINPRHDLKCSGVVLKYETDHLINKKSFRSLTIDKFPENAQETQFKTLVLTIEMAGDNIQTQEQFVKAEKIEENEVSWWKKHLPAIKNIPDANIKIKNVSRDSLAKLKNELLEGSIASWMTGKKVETDVIRATISYQTDDCSVSNKPVAIKIQTTNAETNTYSFSWVKNEAMKPPVGLAEQIYKATSDVSFEGEITLDAENEIDQKESIGHLVNISNGHKSWESMSAIVQEFKQNIDKGTTWIKFGPAKHLGADDFIELTRANRNRVASVNAPMRIVSFLNKTIEHPTHNRIESNHSQSGFYSKLVFKNPNHQNNYIRIDTSDLPEKDQVVVKMRPFYVAENGQLKLSYILSSESLSQDDQNNNSNNSVNPNNNNII